MEKIQVLVRDDKGLFLKMFKNNFADEFKFTQDSFLISKKPKSQGLNRSIFVVYSRQELIEFLKLEKKGTIALVCLFDKLLYANIAVLEEINNLIALSGYQTKRGIVNDLKVYLKTAVQSKSDTIQSKVLNVDTKQIQSNDLYKTVLYFV
ncbi:hypothetical protein [Flavobacterium sp. YO12]|uniref:hypothetical protein n=1 Tax=unclassified Flavobacterium TaxID=196869 RepID=UPI00100AC279|nr:hypothetical protein [Flavobacterium sp. YO12]RXM42877.1 hypothetical protein BOW55_19980 [Flavobacterium sp. YO12]